jgi:hypothetical protein
MVDSAARRSLAREHLMPLKPDNTLYCSFCGKSQHEAFLLIAGFNVYICDECVDIAVQMVASKRADEKFFADAKRCTFCMPEPLNA